MAAPQPPHSHPVPDDPAPVRPWSIAAVPPERTRDLRRRILGGGPGRYLDDVGPTGLHLGAFDAEGRLIGSAAVHPEPFPVDGTGAEPQGLWRLRAMAVEPEWRGRDLGTDLVRAVLAHARFQGALGLWCHALESARGFYLRLGFVDASEPFVRPGAAPHRTMLLGPEPEGG